MKIWDEIIHTALLGTDKKQLSLDETSVPFAGLKDKINQMPSLDKEDQFLHLAAIVLNYRQCGRMPFPMEGAEMTAAEPETKPYSSAKAFQILKDILAEDNHTPLLKFWLKQCSAVERLIRPEIIPDLFSVAVQQKELRANILQVCGKRGEWLGKFNASWQFSAPSDPLEIWQTGTIEERKNILKLLRQTDPAKAREWVSECWDKENAAVKIDFLKQFEGNLTADDKDWLEALPSEKSLKLRDMILLLLKQLPGSSVVEMYWRVLQQAITLKKEKALLGMMNKLSLHIEPPEYLDDSLVKTGVEKLSNDKLFNDDEFALYQMMSCIPPAYWESHLAINPEQIIQQFQKEKSHKKYLSAIAGAIIRFHDSRWAQAFLQQTDLFYIPVLSLLPKELQEKYCLRNFDLYPEELIQFSSSGENTWSIELSKSIIRYAARNPYKYNRLFFNENIERLPGDIYSALSGIQMPEEHLQTQWEKTNAHILKLHSIKQETQKAFKD